VLHVPGADADADVGDRNYLVLAKPNVIMNDIRVRGLAVAGRDASGRGPRDHAQTARNLNAPSGMRAARARLIQAENLAANRLPTSQPPSLTASRSHTGSSVALIDALDATRDAGRRRPVSQHRIGRRLPLTWLMAHAYWREACPRPSPTPTESHASAGRPLLVRHQRADSNQHLVSLTDLQCDPNESIG
jgi:hypothetical protein